MKCGPIHAYPFRVVREVGFSNLPPRFWMKYGTSPVCCLRISTFGYNYVLLKALILAVRIGFRLWLPAIARTNGRDARAFRVYECRKARAHRPKQKQTGREQV